MGEENSPDFSHFQGYLWPVLGLECLLAMAGNAMALYHFVAWERTWHSGIVYSFNLALSGLLYSLSLPLLVIYYYPPKNWTYGLALCKLERFLFTCNLYGSIVFLACISLTRYVSIVHPFLAHRRLESRHAKLLSAAGWVLAATLAAPTLHFSQLQKNKNWTECLGSATQQQLPQYLPYSLSLAAVGCGLPFLLTVCSYLAILRTVWHNPNIPWLEKRKVGQLVTVGLALYAVSYLPYHILRNLNLSQRLKSHSCDSLSIHTAYQVSKVLVTLNICAHPLLYSALAHSMRGCCGTGPRRSPGELSHNLQLTTQGSQAQGMSSG